jgi:hypothetical protein
VDQNQYLGTYVVNAFLFLTGCVRKFSSFIETGFVRIFYLRKGGSSQKMMYYFNFNQILLTHVLQTLENRDKFESLQVRHSFQIILKLIVRMTIYYFSHY